MILYCLFYLLFTVDPTTKPQALLPFPARMTNSEVYLNVTHIVLTVIKITIK